MRNKIELPKKVLDIAKKVRKAYIKYNHKYAYFDDKLGGACGEASTLLYFLLKNNGFNPKFRHGIFDPTRSFGHDNSHCWIELDNTWIVDVTATQFGVKNAVYANLIIKDRRYCPYRVNEYGYCSRRAKSIIRELKNIGVEL